MTWIILITFFVGYLFIVVEHQIKLDKAATALITGVLCWMLYSFTLSEQGLIHQQLSQHLADIAGILFFLLGAMTIVELIDLHDGFQLIIDKINTNSKRKLLIILTIVTFLLSSILDNLTTAIVMSSLVRKMLTEKNDRLYCIGMIVIAANAGGAWSPIGDVTTTMLWIKNQVSPLGIIRLIFIPSLVATVIPLLFFMFKMKGKFIPIVNKQESRFTRYEQSTILYSGLFLIIFVPIFKLLTHLPPYMGMMLAVGVLWLISEILHRKKHEDETRQSAIYNALEQVDMPSILFFMGILLSVSALESTGILQTGAKALTHQLKNDNLLVTSVGLLSSVFDNVPLVAAMQGMFDLTRYPTDHFFWTYLAFCSGTGGSIFIIGSAAGVAAMGIEEITFFWYLKNISLAALLGYGIGAFTCILLS